MPAVREGGRHPDIVGGFLGGEPVHAGSGPYFIAPALSHGRGDRGIERGAQRSDAAGAVERKCAENSLKIY
jgi:hypothetical protein